MGTDAPVPTKLTGSNPNLSERDVASTSEPVPALSPRAHGKKQSHKFRTNLCSEREKNLIAPAFVNLCPVPPPITTGAPNVQVWAAVGGH